MKRIRKTLAEKITAHENREAYCSAKAVQWANRAQKSGEKAQALRDEITEATRDLGG